MKKNKIDITLKQFLFLSVFLEVTFLDFYQKNMDQKQWNNIQVEIISKNWIIYWKVRNWKTIQAITLALDFHPRIYSNFNIYRKNISIVNFIESYQQIKNIRYSHTRGVLIIDEAGLNANWKDWLTKDSRLLEEILFLCWKKNLSLIWIAQRFESINVNVRALADVIIEMKKISRWKYKPTFIVIKKKQKWINLIHVNSYRFDILGLLKWHNITYNTLEESKLAKTKDLKDKPLKNNV